MLAKSSSALLGTAVGSDGVSDAESVTQLVPGASPALAHLSDNEVLARTRHLVAKSNQVLAALLMHLSEVEARAIYRARACTSLYTYCIYELRFSEDAAARRSSAAKLVRRFPALLDAIAAGELHLTGLLMLGPHLSDENHREVLARAKFRTKKELGKLLRRLAPLPQVPDSIEPLRPALPKAPRNPTWVEFVESLCPPIRELQPGERPNDWASDTIEGENEAVEVGALGEAPSTAPARAEAKRRFGAKASPPHPENQPPKVSASKPTGTPRARQPSPDRAEATQPPRRRDRYIPAAVRRAAFERDEARCSYVDERGQRCRETHGLELHHLKAFAKGGRHVLANLTLRCVTHNTLAAEQDFGRDHIAQKRNGCRHESQRRAAGGSDARGKPNPR